MRYITRYSRLIWLCLLLALSGLTIFAYRNYESSPRRQSAAKANSSASKRAAERSSAASVIAPTQSGGSFNLPQIVIAGGGERSTGGGNEIEGTIGQSLTGHLSGGTFAIEEGFWPDAVPAQSPTISAIGVTRTAGSPSANSKIATALDAEDIEETLQITISSDGMSFGNTATLNGVTVTLTDSNTGATGINPNTTGQAFADVVAACAASNASFTLKVRDSGGAMATATLVIMVNTNLPPTLTYGGQVGVAGGSLSVHPATAADNGSITSFALQNPGGYTGTISVNPATGEVTLSNIKPTGVSTITIRATDNCGLESDASFLLTVSCQTITVGPASIVSGNPGIPYSQQFTQSGGVGAVAFSTASTLPTGINLSSNGLLSGTTTQTGSFPITIKVTDSNGCMGTASYTLAIGCPTITVTAPAANTGAAGVAFSQSFAQSGGTAGTTFSAGGPLPNGLTLSTGGLLSGTPTQIGTFPITVTATSSGGCTGMVNYILTINCPTVSLSSLAGGTAGAAYSQTLTASPNGGNYSFALTAGSLPPGLSLAVNGVLTGLPTQAGTFTFTVAATGFGNCTGAKAYSLLIACPAITLSPASLPGASVNTSYSQTVGAAPSGTGYSFSITSGSLPNGLTLNASTGAITGLPIQTGTSNFRITAKGWGDCIGFRDYMLTVGCPGVSVTPGNLPGGTTGTAYNQSVSAMPAGTYSYSITSGALPTGLTLNAATGAITGTPSQAGNFTFTITASVSSCSGARSFTVTIACPAITLASLGGATAGVSFSGSVAASPSGAYTYSLQSGNLPSGFTLNPFTGAITGMTTVPGTYSFTVKAQILNGCSGSQQYSLTVGCPSITLSALATPSLNSVYNQSVTASPLGIYSFAITAGALPAGLSLNAASGVISGTPTVAGTFSFTIRATVFGSCTGVREYSFVIGGGGCPAITLPASVSAGSVGQLYNSSVVASPAGLYNYAVAAGSLPPGVTLNSFLGTLFGYPTAVGSYGFTVRATGANNCANSQAYTVNIGLGLMPESLPQAVVGQAYRQALASPGAQGEARFAVVAGALPSEMNLSRDGLLTGTPQQPGTHAFTVQVSDSAGFSGKRDYLLVLPPIFPPPSDPLTMTAAIDSCAAGGGTASVMMTVRNFGVVSAPVNFEAPLPAGARALPDSCEANLGGCAATPQQVAWNGNLNLNQTVTITFRVQFDDNLSAQTCITASAKVVNVFGAPAAVSACAVNCTVVGPGARLAAASPASDVKAGSVLIYNIYTSATDPARQNTRLSITNTDPARQAFVHLFFVDGASCSVADSFLCLTPNQTTSFLASDLDPGTTGYVVAVATDAAGCPVNFNFLIGDEYVKFQSGHQANLGAEAITAIAGGLPFCNTNSSTALLSFDGVSYNTVPHALAADNIPSRADGNDTLLVLNRIGGNLGIGAATLGSLFGLFYDDAETSVSFTFTPGTCQFRGSISNNFPRLAPRFEQFVPAGRSGWFKVWMPGLFGMTGAVINFNANAGASAGAFNQGHNLHALTNTETANYIIPIFPPNC